MLLKTPSAANNWLRMVRMLMQFAIELNMRTDDPTIGIKTFKIKSDGFAIWGADHIAAYRPIAQAGRSAG